MNEQSARRETCRVGRSLIERGYVHTTAGNISVRLADGFLITPTDVAQQIGLYARARRPIRAVMLERLGPNVWHESPGQAMAVLEELEETARLCCMVSPAPAPLDEAEIEGLRRQFAASW